MQIMWRNVRAQLTGIKFGRSCINTHAPSRAFDPSTVAVTRPAASLWGASHVRYSHASSSKDIHRLGPTRLEIVSFRFRRRCLASDLAVGGGGIRNKSTQREHPRTPPPPPPTSPVPHSSQHLLFNRLSNIHAPTKEELLAAATGFWSRLKIRFKWFSIRSNRPFNVDDIGGFISWIFFGHLVWVIVGTTTFFSLAILAVNTVFAQETLGRWVGQYLTSSSGLQVVFEEAIVPKWRDGVISFSNVFVSRRPGAGSKVSKGSISAIALAAAPNQVHDDGNYTQYDVTIETVNVTLSFTKWFNGRGILKDVEIKGVRGVIDRTNVHEDSDWGDPQSHRRQHRTGDFELDSFKLENLLLTVHQPGHFRPFNVSIFACDLPRLRQHWLFYDFLSANTMSGSYDNSLFTLHPRQSLASPAAHGRWKNKDSRLRIDGLNFDHINRGREGPFAWIREGHVDIVADIRLPADEDDSVVKVLSNVFDRVEATVAAASAAGQQQQHDNVLPPTVHGNDERQIMSIHADQEPTIVTPEATAIVNGPEQLYASDEHNMIMDLRVTFRDVRAAVPLFTKEISYVNNALIRPIVAYINSRRALLPISCRVVKPRGDFDGAWSAWDSSLLDDVNRETYDAFVRDILDDASARQRRIKKVGIWTFQLVAQALFIGMAGNFA